MAAVGLFYVGAVLFVNGLMLLGRVSPRGAAPLNLFVGTFQVVVPTLLLLRAETPAEIAAAAPLYLFGFTYLWVGINACTGWEGRGLGWFSLFVALAAVGFAWHSLTVVGDPTFAVIWLYWALLWSLFFVVLGLQRDELTVFTGWVTVVQGFVTAAIPAFLILVERWAPDDAVALGLVALALVVFGGLWAVRDRLRASPPLAGTE